MGERRVIYEFPSSSDNLQQGDIFVNLPRIDISLKEVVIASEVGERVVAWEELAIIGKPVNAIVPVRPVTCIVATQDCDAKRSHDITLCEIRSFKDVERKCKDTSSPKSWKNIITQHARINQKWFYLPQDKKVGLREKMAVDFMVTLRVSRQDLEDLRFLRKGHLNSIAGEHFRERISEFFRRYPYDEWYPLNTEEFKAYSKEYPDTPPFDWQEVENKEKT